MFQFTDGEDPCKPELVNDGQCDVINDQQLCLFDGTDCGSLCDATLMSNGNCDTVNNIESCDYDKGDCDIISFFSISKLYYFTKNWTDGDVSQA
jgi:hypothetical protein